MPLHPCVKNYMRSECGFHNLAISFPISHSDFNHLLWPDALTEAPAVSVSGSTAYAPGCPAWRRGLARQWTSHRNRLNGRDSAILQKSFTTAPAPAFSPRTVPRHPVAADVSRRILRAAEMAPTDVGGYAGMKSPGEGTQSTEAREGNEVLSCLLGFVRFVASG